MCIRDSRLAIVFEQNNNDGGAVYVDDVQFTGPVAPEVVSLEVAGGESQRSTVDSISVVFDGDVDLAAGAVSLVQRSTQTAATFEAVTSNVSTQLVNNQTIATIQFTSHVRNADGALVDGNYQLTLNGCLLYTSPSPRDRTRSRMPSSA